MNVDSSERIFSLVSKIPWYCYTSPWRWFTRFILLSRHPIFNGIMSNGSGVFVLWGKHSRAFVPSDEGGCNALTLSTVHNPHMIYSWNKLSWLCFLFHNFSCEPRKWTHNGYVPSVSQYACSIYETTRTSLEDLTVYTEHCWAVLFSVCLVEHTFYFTWSK
jgi:hypothetical protein